MIEIFSKDVAFKLKALGVYQVIFGLMGLGVTFWLLIQTTFSSILLDILFTIPLALYSYSIYCGILLFQKQEAAFKHTAINQYLQLVSFSILGYAFKYVSGLMFTVGVDFIHSYVFDFHFGVMSTWNLQIATQSDEIVINFNLVAFALIIFIDRLKMKISVEQDLQVMSIGEDVGRIEG